MVFPALIFNATQKWAFLSPRDRWVYDASRLCHITSMRPFLVSWSVKHLYKDHVSNTCVGLGSLPLMINREEVDFGS